jgi:hypothetical protein
MSTGASEMVTVPRADLDAMKAELRRLRREVGRAEALAALAMRVKGVVAELQRRGYPVVDRRWTMLPLPQGIVPWHDPDSDAGHQPTRMDSGADENDQRE